MVPERQRSESQRKRRVTLAQDVEVRRRLGDPGGGVDQDLSVFTLDRKVQVIAVERVGNRDRRHARLVLVDRDHRLTDSLGDLAASTFEGGECLVGSRALGAQRLKDGEEHLDVWFAHGVVVAHVGGTDPVRARQTPHVGGGRLSVHGVPSRMSSRPRAGMSTQVGRALAS